MHIYIYIHTYNVVARNPEGQTQLWLKNRVLWGSRLSHRTLLKGFFSPEDKAAAVSDSEDGLVVVKILSVPMVFMKKFYVLAEI